MKRAVAIFLFLIPLVGYSQEISVLPNLLATGKSTDVTYAETQLVQLVNHLERCRGASDLSLLKKVFHETQKKFLHQYVAYSAFGEIFEKGNYDCLTATSLFAVVLDRLNFNFSILETNYHIFILVKTSQGEVLLETTDKYNGFVRNENDMRERIGNYRNTSVGIDATNVYRYSFDLYHEVTPEKLPGLLYYNQAVKAFNREELENSAELLLKAHSIYDTPRITEFSYIILQSVMKSDMTEIAKAQILQKFKSLSARKSAVLAAR